MTKEAKKEIETITVSEALAQGYGNCLQNNKDIVELIKDVEAHELATNVYLLSDTKKITFSVSAEEIKELVADHVRGQGEVNDEADVLGDAIDAIPVEAFEFIAGIINLNLLPHFWYKTLNVRLIPDAK